MSQLFLLLGGEKLSSAAPASRERPMPGGWGDLAVFTVLTVPLPMWHVTSLMCSVLVNLSVENDMYCDFSLPFMGG